MFVFIISSANYTSDTFPGTFHFAGANTLHQYNSVAHCVHVMWKKILERKTLLEEPLNLSYPGHFLPVKWGHNM